MTDLETIKRKLYQKKNEIGLVGGTFKITEYDETEHNVAAHIMPQGWGIEINLKKGFNPVTDRRQKAYARKKKIEDGLETLLSDIMLHECAHWELPQGSQRGCPYDIYHHDVMLEAVTNALPSNKKGMARYVLNAFEDMIINPRCNEFNGNFNGQVLFWDNEGVVCKQQGQKGYTSFYEAFVKLNMHLFGDSLDKSLLKRHYTNDAKVDKGVRAVVDHLSLPKRITATDVLFDKPQWPTMAATFAKDLGALLDEPPRERLSAYSSQGIGGEGTQEPEAGNGIEQKMGTREGAEAVAFGRYAGNNKQSPNFTSFEQLDTLYQRLARSIQVKVESMTRQQSIQIAPLNYRPFDEERDNPMKMKTSKMYVTDAGLQFGHPNQPLTVDANMKMQRHSFPDFKLIMLDNSGSMREALDNSNNIGSTAFIPWGDASKYHYALLGLYGVENFLQQQNIAQYIRHGLSLFSSSTRYKEDNFSGIDVVRRHALSPDWGSTNLDASVLTSALAGKESFVLSLSDGDISNWDSEKSNFRESVANNHYAHIQLGGKTAFTQDLESWDVPVFYVTKGDHLAHLMVDITKNTYRRFTHQ
ncbi:MAG TPA: hypothetical protein VJH21_02745 [Candidatus Paceibacterota bacterium]